MFIAPADGDLLRVEVLEQRLGELPRCPELVSELCHRYRPATALADLHDPAAQLLQRIAVVMKRPGDAHRAPGAPKRRQVVRVKLGVEWGLESSLPEAAFERQLPIRELRLGSGGWSRTRGRGGGGGGGSLDGRVGTRVRRFSAGQTLESAQQVSARAVLARMRVQDSAATKRVRRGNLPDDQPIPSGRYQLALEPELPEATA
jgi:hypothetical protein